MCACNANPNDLINGWDIQALSTAIAWYKDWFGKKSSV